MEQMHLIDQLTAADIEDHEEGVIDLTGGTGETEETFFEEDKLKRRIEERGKKRTK
jgi:hypothetical protein